MARIHLFEWEDQAWFPKRIRNYMVDFLDFVAGFSNKPFQGIADKLSDALDRSRTDTLIDLCSGSGGPIGRVLNMLKTAKKPRAVLTDLYPNIAAFERLSKSHANIGYVAEPVDASQVPKTLRGFRTMFNSFHHFRPASARRILKDCVDQNQGVAVVEMVSRSGPAIVSVLFNTVMLLFTTPFIKPFRWGRILFTYLIPVVPICIVWDGLVSCLRVYSPAELDALILPEMRQTFDWEVGKWYIGKTPLYLTYLIGMPKSAR